MQLYFIENRVKLKDFQIISVVEAYREQSKNSCRRLNVCYKHILNVSVRNSVHAAALSNSTIG